MSELNVYHHELRPGEYDEFYLKYEADKVIADLQADYKEACDRLQTANLIKDEQLAATRHQKYKRCLAMAKWCDEVMMSYELRGYNVHRIWARKHEWAMRWKYKWLELAEKFKEAK